MPGGKSGQVVTVWSASVPIGASLPALPSIPLPPCPPVPVDPPLPVDCEPPPQAAAANASVTAKHEMPCRMTPPARSRAAREYSRAALARRDGVHRESRLAGDQRT